ncbi:hypothetical protein [Micromonospora radicis]|uniref:Uncharacterized protein n=1 Tax=Micromonospora radicis TaxID=1894971 RepID=A0A418N185_9ACTN|nr:hypothetical protein [Micromonospora radicis]RIV40896.1 hypothetical protein D2L64_04730 [Micromonospora radicis]
MAVIFIHWLLTVDPAPAPIWLPSATAALKFLSALVGFLATAVPVALRVYRSARQWLRRCAVSRG